MLGLAAVAALAEGIAVGVGFAALVVLLMVAVRLAQITGTERWASAYQWAMALGALAAGLEEARPMALRGGPPLAVALSLGMGLFIGLFVGALTETVAALLLAGHRLGLARYLRRLVLAVVGGKVLGALAWFLIPSLFTRPPP